jgi:nucleoside-diphosphate-sugar epimerase
MRIVVTGATGNVGTSLLDALAEDDRIDAIVGLARRAPDLPRPKTTWIATDVARDDLVSRFRGADAVVHLAWIFQPTHDPLRTWRNNVLGSMRVFEAVATAGVPTLLHASSVGAYSPGPPTGTVDERWPTHALPTAAYGREKSYLERVLDAFERAHPDVRVVRMRPGFIFKRASAAAQRRLFAGPLLPGLLARPGFVPVLPDLPGLRFQALHSSDAAEAYRRAITSDVRGAINLAAEPVLDTRRLAELFDARVVRVPTRAVRAAVAAAWRLHAIPASPTLVDLTLSLPVMDTTRARTELGWVPQHSSLDAIRAFLDGLRSGEGGATPTLHAGAGGRLRWREFATRVGGRDRVPER